MIRNLYSQDSAPSVVMAHRSRGRITQVGIALHLPRIVTAHLTAGKSISVSLMRLTRLVKVMVLTASAISINWRSE